MTPKPDNLSETIDALHGLTGSVLSLSAEIELMHRTDERRKKLMRVLAISVVFDILLSVGLGVVAFQQDRLAKENSRNSSAAVVGCQASNRAIDNQKRLWQPILDSTPPPTTPEARKQRDDFQAILDTPHADCDRL